jgi:thiamine pyrophosphate-dependent acetolactate synthase large subunit-like protein
MLNGAQAVIRTLVDSGVTTCFTNPGTSDRGGCEPRGAPATWPALQRSSRPTRPSGALTAEKVCEAIGVVLPDRAIVSDEAVTSGATLPVNTAGAPRHDWLTLTGGAIGQGLPVVVGAAVACPQLAQ